MHHKPFWLATLCALCLNIALLASASAQSAIEKYTTPGENHKHLNSLVGKWEHTVLLWDAPGAQPKMSKGTTDASWIMDGRFVRQEGQGQWKDKPFTTLTVIGYDNVAQEFNTMRINNMGTGMTKGSAQYDATQKVFNEQGTYSCPVSHEKNKKYRATWKIIDDDHYTYEMYTGDKEGNEFKLMEISYSRAK